MNGWDVSIQQRDNDIAVECLATDATIDPLRHSLRLFGFPVSFNSVGAAEGPMIEFGNGNAATGHLFPIPAATGYGPYSLTVLVENMDGGAPQMSDAVGLVLRNPDKVYGVTLKRDASDTDVRTTHRLTGYRLRVQVAETVGIPKALFLHRLSNDALGRLKDDFLAVCRPADFADCPENRPDSGQGKYRLPYVDVVMHHPDELEYVWATLEGDVRRLVATMESLRRLQNADVAVL